MNMYRSVWEGLSVHVISGQRRLGCLCISVIFEASGDCTCILCTCLISGQCGLGCLVKSFIRFVLVELAVHVKYHVSVDWVICACHIYQVIALGCLCMSLVPVSVDWVVCACHLFMSVWIGLSVHATCSSQCELGGLWMSLV